LRTPLRRLPTEPRIQLRLVGLGTTSDPKFRPCTSGEFAGVTGILPGAIQRNVLITGKVLVDKFVANAVSKIVKITL